MRVTTDFDPAVHGFRFRNRFDGGEVIGELTDQGLLGELIGAELPGALQAAVGLARHADFWGTFGLCGGMSWAALDRYVAGEPVPPDTSSPGPGSDLFRELVRRQVESLGGSEVLKRCLLWQALPESTRWWRFWMDSVGRLVDGSEWPALRAALDAGTPQSLCLVRVKGVGSPARNHQVVAVGYELFPDGHLAVDLYDPNRPGATPRLLMRTATFWHRLEGRQTTGEPFRGFFVWPHQPSG